MSTLDEEDLGDDPLELATDYNWRVVGYSGNLPLDICCSVLKNYRVKHMTAKYSGLSYRVGGYLMCPMCSTPWIAGDIRPRLVSVGTAMGIKKLLKKEMKKTRKLTKMEKILISAYRQKGNIIEIKCTKCNHKMREICPYPKKPKEEKNKDEEIISTPSVKKKKKRKTREINAGLNVSSIALPSLNSSQKSSKEGRSFSSTSESFIFDTSLTESVFLPDESVNTSKEMKQKDSGNNSRVELSSLSSLDDQQLLAQRLSESINSSPQHNSNPNSRSGICPGSKPGSRPSSRPGSRPGSRPTSPSAKKKEKKMKLAGLKNAILKENTKNSNKQKRNSLDDFLKTLF